MVCKNCGNSFSDEVTSCPSCEGKIVLKKKSFVDIFQRVLGVILILLFAKELIDSASLWGYLIFNLFIIEKIIFIIFGFILLFYDKININIYTIFILMTSIFYIIFLFLFEKDSGTLLLLYRITYAMLFIFLFLLTTRKAYSFFVPLFFCNAILIFFEIYSIIQLLPYFVYMGIFGLIGKLLMSVSLLVFSIALNRKEKKRLNIY